MVIARDDAAEAIKAARKKAAELGKFYTPESLCKLAARLVGRARRVYDPTCGSGAMLAACDADFYAGEEIDPASCALARQNLIGRNVAIVATDVLANPFDWGEKFDAIVANPPYGVKWNPRDDARFDGLLAPSNKADMAFVQHLLSRLDGIAAVVLPRDAIRDKFAERLAPNLSAIIYLTDKLFEATSIGVALYLFRSVESEDVAIIDARKKYVRKDRSLREISDAQIDEIVAEVAERERVVSNAEFCEGFSLDLETAEVKTPSELFEESARLSVENFKAAVAFDCLMARALNLPAPTWFENIEVDVDYRPYGGELETLRFEIKKEPVPRLFR